MNNTVTASPVTRSEGPVPMARSCRLFASTVALLLPWLALAADGGWKAGLDLTVEAAAGLRGEAQRGQALHGLALVHADWRQTGQPAGGLGFTGYASALVLAGKGPTECFLGDSIAASNIEGYPGARLYSWWLEAHRNDWSLRAGVLLADEEFAGTDAGGNFFNSAFGWPAFISANTVNTGPAFYVPAPGIRLQRTWGGNAAWRLGFYDGDSFDSPIGDPSITRHGLHYQLGGNQGWFVIAEAAFAPAGWATRFKVGGWLHTATFADVRDDASGHPFAITGADPRLHPSNHGAYAAIEHTLAGESGKAGHLEAFVRGGGSPSDRNAVGWAIDAGLGWTGPIPGRPADVAALGFAHARFSSRFSANARRADPSCPEPDFEQVIEAGYTIVLSERFNLQPDVQYIRHPGGGTARSNACVFLFRVNAHY